MAFCEITHDNLVNLTTLVHATIRKNPAALKNLRDFTQGMYTNLVGRNVSPEKAMAMISYVPQLISEFNSDKVDRKLLKDNGVSLDAIQDAEEIFDDYKRLGNYLGLKSEFTPITLVNDNQLAQQ